MIFWQSLSGKILSLLSARFSTHYMKACDCQLFYEHPHQFLHLITCLKNFKSERQQDLAAFHIFTEMADAFILFIGRC